MNLQEIKNILDYFTAKHQSGKTFTSSEYNTMLPVASLQLFKQLYPDFEKRQVFTDALYPFKVFMGQEQYVDSNNNTIPAIPPLMIDSNGYANIPKDYYHYSAIEYKKITNLPGCKIKISFRQVKPVTDQQFNAYQNARVKVSDKKYPICNFQDNYIRFLPIDLASVNFVYLRYPIKPVYGFTHDSTTDQDIYDPATSIELEWHDNEQWEIILFMLSYIGINLTRTDLYEFAQIKNQESEVNNAR